MKNLEFGYISGLFFAKSLGALCDGYKLLDTEFKISNDSIAIKKNNINIVTPDGYHFIKIGNVCFLREDKYSIASSGLIGYLIRALREGKGCFINKGDPEDRIVFDFREKIENFISGICGGFSWEQYL